MKRNGRGPGQYAVLGRARERSENALHLGQAVADSLLAIMRPVGSCRRLKADGLGLNLTVAEYVFLLDPGPRPPHRADAARICLPADRPQYGGRESA